MTFSKRLSYVSIHLQKIGIIATLSYFLQRFILAKGKLLLLRIPGLESPLFLRNKTDDVHIFYQVFIREDLKMNPDERVDTIVDLGANIGLSSLYFKKLFPSANIVGVEPEEENCKLYLKNLFSYQNVELFQGGIFSQDCKMFLLDLAKGEASYRIAESHDHAGAKQVNCISINSLIEKFQLDSIDILKMDIEGCEKECILAEDISWIKKVKYFMVEIHDDIHNGLSNIVFQRLKDYSLTTQGEYKIFNH